jgi:hypothetical protein
MRITVEYTITEIWEESQESKKWVKGFVRGREDILNKQGSLEQQFFDKEDLIGWLKEKIEIIEKDQTQLCWD